MEVEVSDVFEMTSKNCLGADDFASLEEGSLDLSNVDVSELVERPAGNSPRLAWKRSAKDEWEFLLLDSGKLESPFREL
jgi:hypothetical protein